MAVEEPYIDYLSDYYTRVYEKHGEEFFRRLTFICSPDDKPVSTCLLWKAYGLINTIGWFRTLPQYQGRGLGRAILSKVLADTKYPVFLHTHPTSVRAVKLYSDFGFKLLTDPVIGFRENHPIESLTILKKTMPEGAFSKLQMVCAPVSFLEAVKTSHMDEF